MTERPGWRALAGAWAVAGALALLLAEVQAPPAEPFEELTGVIPFVLRNAATPEKHQIETMPGGIAIFDYDNDGLLDIYFLNGAPQPSLAKSGPEWWNRLYRNRGNWRFEDVTEKAGLAGEGYGMGVAAGDYDNDGWTDLLVTSVHFSRLYRNRGDGTFEDVTKKAGIPATHWPISAGWFDMDNDGDLDLFIVNYCIWDPKTEPFCGDKRAGYRTYCHPKYYEGLPNTLLRNNGDGTFTDISKSAGISQKIGKGMSVAFADYNNDGLMDVLVTNDTVPNFLFRNEGNGRFTEIGFTAGIAIADDGKILSTMGAEFRDIDNDGWPDIFVTALANETFPLFRNLGNGVFQDMTYRSRIGAASLPHSGWSLGVADFDLDGWKDIFTANGDVQDNTELFSSRASKQQNQLFRNEKGKTFSSVVFGARAQHRGVALGDLDGDGRTDAAVSVLNEPAKLYRNRLGEGRNWIALRLTGTQSNRDAIGAKVRVTAGGLTQYNHVSTSTGYQCSSEKTLRFGIAGAARADEVEITWPTGKKQILRGVPAGRVIEVKED
ncbi:MAG: RNA-binding protein [Bryobacteraceae bacterium]|nr:MAG: RNA-binding protein [Bryobacteraceae bacterium]